MTTSTQLNPASATTTTPRPIRVLVVEDGEPLRDLLGRALRLEGWDVREVADGASALDAAVEFRPDAIVLDVMLPDMNGIRVVTALRASGDATPVLFLTALHSTADRVDAYMAGGDDYMTKPFSLEGVASHLMALVRAHGVPGRSRTLADLVIDDERREVWRSGDRIDLTPPELRLLDALMASPGERLTAEQLSAAAAAPTLHDAREVAALLASLSKKLDTDRTPLITVTDDARYSIGTPSIPSTP
ncbi:response regulator transcription factor [Subtercola sp. YIM 133946]|uniref:response regulator transcription factor n=1 Tax=Subtercola sp. YIM 133946 TaxID=3118909 RepID=UPI002F9506B5